MKHLTQHPKLTQFGLILLAFAILMYMARDYYDIITHSGTFNKLTASGEIAGATGFFESLQLLLSGTLPPQFVRIPENFVWGLPELINSSLLYLVEDFWKITIVDPEYGFEKNTTVIKEFTRGLAGIILVMINFIREFILGGTKTIASVMGWDFIRDTKASWPALPWPAVASGAFLLGYSLNGMKLALLAFIPTVYIAIFGQWIPAMETLSFILVAAPVSVIIGLSLGVLAYKVRAVEAFFTPLLKCCETLPHFSYLVPVVTFYGVGDQAGAIATIIFATPPMIRLTILGLKKVPPETLEAGMMSGCTKRQLLFKVHIPTARQDILLGVNQVIMQCLAMAVIASFIGATGLGYDLVVALNSLRIGIALELGISIVLIAIVLDKLSLAWANKSVDYLAELPFHVRHKHSLMFLAILALSVIVATVVPHISEFWGQMVYLIPENQGFSTDVWWDKLVKWVVVEFRSYFQIFNAFMLVSVLIPMRDAFLAMPVVATFTLAMGVSYMVGGIKSALVVGGFLLFIAASQWWDEALITMYMTTFAVVVSVIIGLTVGVLAARNTTATKILLIICDTFQTLPSFVYLIPVIMLFGVNDVSVLIAVITYAVIPCIRYTIEGLRNVPPSILDAGDMSGVTKWQRLIKIEMPLAFPHIMLGINQTVVFALFMVIIGAFIGTEDLGRLIMGTLSKANAMGNGLTLGLCVAFIGLAIDHLIHKWADTRKKILGIA